MILWLCRARIGKKAGFRVDQKANSIACTTPERTLRGYVPCPQCHLNLREDR